MGQGPGELVELEPCLGMGGALEGEEEGLGSEHRTREGGTVCPDSGLWVANERCWKELQRGVSGASPSGLVSELEH